ncbi:hypothetical protein HAX54_001241 [Datura stramonium]|uniref:Uncharacterized protein n=1 Tax=Datura stramonium TaxID=4076 RepID=A0ABS8WUC2_DATST|nr:hypothetical protein [Datura stramonium]
MKSYGLKFGQCCATACRSSRSATCRKMYSPRHRDKGKAPMGIDTYQESNLEEEKRISQLFFGLEGMEAYYISFKEKRAIIEEAKFNVDSFKADFLDVDQKFQI